MFLRYLTVVFLLVTAVKGQSTSSVTVDSVSSISGPTDPTSTQTTTTKNSPKPDANQTTTTMSDKTTVNSTLTPSTHPSSNTTSESNTTTITAPTPMTSVSESDKTTVNSTLTPSTAPTSNTTSESNTTTITAPTPATSVSASLLVVVVVSCVLGGILLIIVLTSVIYCLWKGPLKISKSKQSYGINPYTSGNRSQPLSTGFKSFTRATTKCDNDAASENDRMPEGGHLQKPQTNEWRESYDINLDEMTSFKGKNPSCNSSVVQGHVNPHYSPGDEKSN